MQTSMSWGILTVLRLPMEIIFDVPFTLHNILSFKSVEDKQITSLSWQTIRSMTKT